LISHKLLGNRHT